jgi:predicted ABC-type ATPase
MATPRMFVIAGPPGAGKSSVFSLSKFAERTFNADDRAAELNSGSYQDIPLSIRAIVNREFEEFVRANIRSGNSFALETTLRSSITFDQARLAKENGFRVIMRYVALETPELHIERVLQRAARAGHAASETTLRRIHSNSLRNLPTALVPAESGIESVRVYDNSRFGESPRLILQIEQGRIVRMADHFPMWLQSALGWTSSRLVEERQRLRLTP